MTDKERMLLTIANSLAFPDYKEIPDEKRLGAWVSWKKEDLVPGALVSCVSSGRFSLHDWLIGFVVQVNDESDCVIRELGGKRTCRVSNERFYVIRGIDRYALLAGKERQFYERVLLAFRRGGEWAYRFGGLDFNDDGSASIKIREAFGGRLAGPVSMPFVVCVPEWRKTISWKRILQAMRDGGYGSRAFERAT